MFCFIMKYCCFFFAEIVVFFPHFSGNSYLQYNSIDLGGPSSDLYLTFKTSELDGTLLYSADESGRFIHLFIEEGNLKFQMHFEAGVRSYPLTQNKILVMISVKGKQLLLKK